MEYSLKEKYAIIFVLWEIMKADGIIDEREKNFLDRTYVELGISVNELQNIVDMDLVQSQIILKSMTDDKINKANEYFINMCACDGYVDERETEIINWLK